jgi:ribosomal RNA assembly protein
VTNEDFAILPKKKIVFVRKNKELLEKSLEVELRMGYGGEISIMGDSIDVWDAKKVLKAISAGFDIDTAMLLKDDRYVMETLYLEEYARKREAEKRLIGRVVGKEGKSREKIEELTDTFIRVDEKTVNIIGFFEDILDAKEAIIMLLSGSMHPTVFRFLEKKNRDKKIKRMI